MDKDKFIQAYLNAKPLPLDDIHRARAMETRRSTLMAKVPFAGAIDDITAQISLTDSRLRIYRPAGKGPLPGVLYLHGGGFCLGSPETSDNLCRVLAMRVPAVVISVDYQLSPEHKFPAALEQSYQVAQWMKQNDVALDICNDQLAVAGDSAGGNLAAALCLLARERREISFSYQVLICPILDQVTDHGQKNHLIQDSLLTPERSRIFKEYYFRRPEEAHNPLASPLLTESCRDLPPATIISAGRDPLATEALSYAARLETAGIAVQRHHYPDQVHDFVLFIKSLDEARQAAHRISADLTDFFGRGRA